MMQLENAFMRSERYCDRIEIINISIELSIPLRTIQRILTQLQKDGFLRNDGDRKSCRWTVLE